MAESKKDAYEESLLAFEEEFRNSKEYQAWKAADAALYEDKGLRPLIKEKEELESEISKAYQRADGSEEGLLKTYHELLARIDKVPSVQSYYAACAEVKKIKNIFEDEILRKLA
jgi:cell fate (sporulation/competence/biofilm development) regulator YlbF (YheA/YmcA/DUF963 family)